MADRSGQQLESYRLLKRLGGGAFGDVYLAEDHRKRQVAIKILHGDFNAQQLQMFLHEARIMRLRHEHIVSVLDFGVEPTNSTPYIVMDYATQGTLLSRHPRGSRLPLSTIVPYVKQIAAALHEAHEEGIIHRDVKPENILLDHNGSIKLADFGIAVISQSARTSLESPQGKAGTPWYMAPEQIQGKPSRASDQYALATIVYEWLTGEPPFIGGIWEVYGQHLHAPPDPLPNDIKDLTPELEAVLMKALAKNSKDRYATIQDFAAALQAAYEKAIRKQAAPSKSVTELKNEALAFRKAGRSEEAIAVWNQLVLRDPSDANAYYNRGYDYDELHKYEEAIADYTQAIKLNPSDADAYNCRGIAYRAQQKYAEALADYGEAIRLNPSYALAYYNRGLAYYAQQKYAEALADYGEAIRLNPSYAAAYHNRGVAYEVQQKYADALADYGQAIRLNPSDTDAYNGRGNAYYMQQKYSEAIADYDRALKVNPQHENAQKFRKIAQDKLQGR